MVESDKKMSENLVKDTILLVKDNNKDYLTIQRSIYSANLPVYIHAVENVLEAKRYLKQEGIYANNECYPLPTIILANINKPSMSGLDLLTWVEQQPELLQIPVVLVDDFSDKPNIAINVDATSHFAKALSVDGLIDIVKRLLLHEYLN